MKKIQHTAKLFQEYITSFRCPHCQQALQVYEEKSLKCPNNHTFDFTKHGYVNLMTHPAASQYTKELFHARHKIIMETDLYSFLHKEIAKVIKEHLAENYSRFMIVDLGCGEGSHLKKITDSLNSLSIGAVGLDIAKEGIVMAGKNFEKLLWVVGDLANSPLADHAYQVVLNILSPANYQEFQRMLAPGGIVIKVVPRANYLKELRETLYADEEKKTYSNDKIVSLFSQHFKLLDTVTLQYKKELQKEEIESLAKMTPLAWDSEDEKLSSFLNRKSQVITVDLDILIGIKK
ncbi:methyltransferase domain-containing protein [Caldibacillus lycopersici]|uniref:Methyltransferase domain-containing protein n=1 Tax=Perspicuibacillus lycopersici TaxID=1325689 RepID=A0AAE3IWQ3_9BACI|nr:methyltransferase domain-containing protein [Perspicuibacillus lycopersici]MCU9614794.1 methyltransferase domain-containing protein [Perspicuibacillus lycopersici]